LIAGTGLMGDEILYLQSDLILKAEGHEDEILKENKEVQKKMFTLAKSDLSEEVLIEKLTQVLKEQVSKMSEEELEAMGFSEDALPQQAQAVASPWFRFFLNHDPAPVLEKVKCPVLALNGEKDLQVPPKENLFAIEAALKKGGNKQFMTKELQGLNHLLQTAETGAPSEYGKIEETMAPAAMEIISNWILSVVK